MEEASRINLNREIVAKIAAAVESHPEQRFMQLLENVNVIKRNGMEIVDTYYEESDSTLSRMV